MKLLFQKALHRLNREDEVLIATLLFRFVLRPPPTIFQSPSNNPNSRNCLHLTEAFVLLTHQNAVQVQRNLLSPIPSLPFMRYYPPAHA